jgi:hypothetical protein
MLLAYLALIAAAPGHCPRVDLALAEKQMLAAFRGKPFRETSASFRKAYAKACSEDLLMSKPLAGSGRVVLLNAPDANIASIYARQGQTVLEYPFIDDAGRTHVPTVGELHQAIVCALHGASPKEREESGRCLPD